MSLGGERKCSSIKCQELPTHPSPTPIFMRCTGHRQQKECHLCRNFAAQICPCLSSQWGTCMSPPPHQDFLSNEVHDQYPKGSLSMKNNLMGDGG